MKKMLILSLTFALVLLGVIGYFKYKDYRMGDVSEREDILVAVSYDLFHKKDIDLDEINKIQVHRQDAGVYPFFYMVSVKIKDGKSYEYKWKDEDKSELDIIVDE